MPKQSRDGRKPPLLRCRPRAEAEGVKQSRDSRKTEKELDDRARENTKQSRDSRKVLSVQEVLERVGVQ